MKRFRGGLVCKAHRLVYHLTLGWRVIKKKKKTRPNSPLFSPPAASSLLCFRVHDLGLKMCSGSKTASYLRLIDFVYHLTLGLRVIKKKREGGAREMDSSTIPTPTRPAAALQQSNLIRFAYLRIALCSTPRFTFTYPAQGRQMSCRQRVLQMSCRRHIEQRRDVTANRPVEGKYRRVQQFVPGTSANTCLVHIKCRVDETRGSARRQTLLLSWMGWSRSASSAMLPSRNSASDTPSDFPSANPGIKFRVGGLGFRF